MEPLLLSFSSHLFSYDILLVTNISCYLSPLNKPCPLSERCLTLHHLISPRGKICQMESLSQAMLVCLIFKQQWTLHETKIAASFQVQTHSTRGQWTVCVNRPTWGSCSEQAGLRLTPIGSFCQLPVTSGPNPKQKHAPLTLQLDSATHHLPG